MIRFISSLFLFVFISCSSGSEKKISSLIDDFSESKNNFEEFNYSDVIKALEGYKENLKLVKKCVDSVESEFVIEINNYKGMKKSALKFIKNYNEIQQNIIFEKNQLENLKYDIENELLIMDSIDKFLLIEQNNINKISNDIKVASESYEFIKSTNKRLYPYIKEFAEKYCRKNEM